MAEGPQVKIRTEWLSRQLVGRTVVSCDTPRRELAKFADAVTARAAVNTFCKGKHIFLEFDGDLFLHNHLLMRGSWRRYDGRLLFPPEGAWLSLDVGTHTVCNLNGQMLRVESPEGVQRQLSKLGPDVMASPYPTEDVAGALASVNGTIGPALLEQSLVCGLGNIAKSEALYAAGIDPRTNGKQLGVERVSLLVEAIRAVCMESYGKGGRWECKVYRRHGQQCARCGGTIKRFPQDKRMTYCCPECQS
jgi:endonuclease-8